MKNLSIFIMVFLMLPFATALTATPDGGFFPGQTTVEVQLSGAEGNLILYTLDGSNPMNGTEYVVNETLNLTKRNSTPSSFATNPETSIYPFPMPSSTIKATILRATEIDAVTGERVGNITMTYFIDLSSSDFNQFVFSVVIEDEQLQGYENGMYVKGSTYYNDLNATGGNPLDPFRPANWNNDSMRWPAHVEMYREGVRFINDNVIGYPSGQWSAALQKKSIKLKYDKAVGPQTTTALFFGNESPTSMNKIWLKQGGQDFNGLGMRDCIAAEVIANKINVEETQCTASILFINGEYYGVMNINQDIDAKYLANRYGINKDDVVLLEQDGLVEEGKPIDNVPYFELKAWVTNASTNFSDNATYNEFKQKVNVESLIDHMSVQMFFNNDDYPGDYRMWRNKKNTSQVPNTSYDGRWYFQPKDLDQSAGLYSQIGYDENIIEDFLSQPDDQYGYFLFIHTMQNDDFRQQFVDRNIVLLDTVFSSSNVNETVDMLAAERRSNIDEEFSRWQKPPSWENDLVAYKAWIAKRGPYYKQHVLLYGTPTIVVNETNTTNTTDPYLLIAQLQANITMLQARIVALEANMTICVNTVNVCTAQNVVLQNNLSACLAQINVTLPPVNNTNTTNTTTNTTTNFTQFTIAPWQVYKHQERCYAQVCTWTIKYVDQQGSNYAKFSPATTNLLDGSRVFVEGPKLKVEPTYSTLTNAIVQGSPTTLTLRVDKVAQSATISWSNIGANGVKTVPFQTTGEILAISGGMLPMTIQDIVLS